MVAAARMIKSLDSDAKVIFIGPCIAKKAEAKDKDLNDAVDFVLTFQELDEVFRALDIKPGDLDGVPSVEYASRGGRLYAAVVAFQLLYQKRLKNFSLKSTSILKLQKPLE